MKDPDTARQLTRILRLAHRQGGVILSVFLVLLSVTGVMLNHTIELGLHEADVPPVIAKRYYSSQSIEGYFIAPHYFYVLGDALYMDDRSVTQCSHGLTGVARLPQEYVVGCGHELILLSVTGEFIERLGAAHGVPADIVAVTGIDGMLLLKGRTVVRFDINSLTVQAFEVAEAKFPTPVTIPGELVFNDAVSWEQFVLDVHSGQFLGRAGPWIQDFVALLLCLLGLSGVIMFFIPRPDAENRN